MSQRDEMDAAYIAELQEQLREDERLALEDRIKSNFEVDKINRLSGVCKEFLESKAGRFIQNEAAKQSEAAKDRLAALRMEDFKSKDHFLDKIKELQSEAHIPALVITWLHRAIQKATEEAELQHEE